MQYNWKALQEILWGLVIAVVLNCAQILITVDAAHLLDWRNLLLTLIVASIRAASGAVIAALTGGNFSKS